MIHSLKCRADFAVRMDAKGKEVLETSRSTVLVPVVRWNKDNGPRGKETIDTFFLPSVSELNGGYEFFKNEKTRVKVNDEGETCWYWTRSARLGSAHYVHLVHPSGYCVIATAHGGGRCLPACTIAA